MKISAFQVSAPIYSTDTDIADISNIGPIYRFADISVDVYRCMKGRFTIDHRRYRIIGVKVWDSGPDSEASGQAGMLNGIQR